MTLKPARQAVLQALMLVESSYLRGGGRQSSLPHVRTFLRVLTGSCCLNSEVAWRIPDLFRDAAERQSTPKQVEKTFDVLIASRGELFLEVAHTRTDRLHNRERMAQTSREAHRWRQTQSLIEQAKVELNFQSPETISRWSDEVDASRLLCAETRFP